MTNSSICIIDGLSDVSQLKINRIIHFDDLVSSTTDNFVSYEVDTVHLIGVTGKVGF